MHEGVYNEGGRRGIKQYINFNDGRYPVRNSGSEVDLADVIPDSFVSLLVAVHDADAASLHRSRSDKECYSLWLEGAILPSLIHDVCAQTGTRSGLHI